MQCGRKRKTFETSLQSACRFLAPTVTPERFVKILKRNRGNDVAFDSLLQISNRSRIRFPQRLPAQGRQDKSIALPGGTQFFEQRYIRRLERRLARQELRISLDQGDIGQISRRSIQIDEAGKFRAAKMECRLGIQLTRFPENPVLRQRGMGNPLDLPLGHVAHNAAVGRSPALERQAASLYLVTLQALRAK